MPNKEIEAEAWRMYYMGCNDRYVRRKLNKKFGLKLSETHILKWRKSNNLLPNRTHTISASCDINSDLVGVRILDLMNRGYTDAVLGRELGFSPALIYTWKIRHGIKMGIRTGDRSRLSDEERAVRTELYNRGLSDIDIGNELGLSYRTIYLWRKTNGLGRNMKMVVPNE
jgi:hypothetical protein